MAKMMNEQTAKTVKDALPREAPYRMVDGSGLYLLVNPNPAGSKLWRLKHKGSLLALGAYPAMTLTQARARRDAAKLPGIPGIPNAPRDTARPSGLRRPNGMPPKPIGVTPTDVSFRACSKLVSIRRSATCRWGRSTRP